MKLAPTDAAFKAGIEVAAQMIERMGGAYAITYGDGDVCVFEVPKQRKLCLIDGWAKAMARAVRECGDTMRVREVSTSTSVTDANGDSNG